MTDAFRARFRCDSRGFHASDVRSMVNVLKPMPRKIEMTREQCHNVEKVDVEEEEAREVDALIRHPKSVRALRARLASLICQNRPRPHLHPVASTILNSGLHFGLEEDMSDRSPSSPQEGEAPASSSPSFPFFNHDATTLPKHLPPSIDDKPTARQKRKRTSPEDQAVLEAFYARDPKPDKAARLELVKQVALGEKEVQVSLLEFKLVGQTYQWPADLVSESTTELA